MLPAERPASVSTRAGERPACLTSVISYIPVQKESNGQKEITVDSDFCALACGWDGGVIVLCEVSSDIIDKH